MSSDEASSASTTKKHDYQAASSPLGSSEGSAASPCAVINPTVELLTEGIVGLLRPSIEGLDQRVTDTRSAQEQLRKQIDDLSHDLEVIQRAESGATARERELETAIDKLNNAKKRVVVVANLLQGAQDRLNRVHQSCLKETGQRRTLLEPSTSVPAAAADQEPPSAPSSFSAQAVATHK